MNTVEVPKELRLEADVFSGLVHKDADDAEELYGRIVTALEELARYEPEEFERMLPNLSIERFALDRGLVEFKG
jgi:hypothetical protein